MHKLLSITRERVLIGPTESTLASSWREKYGLSALDALHLACATTLRTDVFLTTDDRLLRTCHRMAAGETPFAVTNPLNWLTHFSGHE